MKNKMSIYYPRLVAIADTALLIELGEVINENINNLVLNLDKKILTLKLKGINETVPSYRSLLIHYNPMLLSFSELKEQLQPLLISLSPELISHNSWKIPVCYGGEFGMDLETVACLNQLTTSEVIKIHCQSIYRVYMIGFAPGYCYLGGLNPKIHTARLGNPRLKVPAGSVAIGGQQSIIGSLAMPSGWRLLGQTPVRTFAPERQQPFIIYAGDSIQFYSINKSEFHSLQIADSKGEFTVLKKCSNVIGLI